jgi:threonine synthase
MTSRLYSRYAQFLPHGTLDAPIDIGQGFTPLVRSRAIGPRAGIGDLFFKLESLNPTGSYKDRFAGLAIGMLVATGVTQCIATSSGNTGAALAAFSAAVGIRCALYVSENAPIGKLEQMLAYGADVYRVERFTIDAEESARVTDTLVSAAKQRNLELFITAYAKSPVPMEGVKTIAHEIHDELGGVGDVFVPVGGAGLYVAMCRGFDDLVSDQRLAKSPRVHVVQPAGNDTIAGPLRHGGQKARQVSTSTSISGLGVGYVLDGTLAIEHARRNGGQGYCLDESRIMEVQRMLAHEEGILVEPAGAVAVAGALEAVARGELNGQGPVVCLLTGHGFKDPTSVRGLGAAAGARLIGRDRIEATLDDPRA